MKTNNNTTNCTNNVFTTPNTTIHTNLDGTQSLRIAHEVKKFDFAAYKANRANNVNKAVTSNKETVTKKTECQTGNNYRDVTIDFVAVKHFLKWVISRAFTGVPAYIYECEANPTFCNIWNAAVHTTKTVIYKRLENRPDNANLRMLAGCISKIPTDNKTIDYYYLPADNTLNPVYDLIHVAFESIWKMLVNSENTWIYDSETVWLRGKWLTLEKTIEVPSNVVIVGLDGKNTVEMKTVTKPAYRFTYDEISRAMSAYDTFKWNDNRYSYVELDALEVDGVEYKMYERLSYHIDNTTESENIGFEIDKCNFNKEEMEILDYRMLHNYVGYKTIAHSLKKSENTVKSQMQRMQTKVLKAYGWKKVETHVKSWYKTTKDGHEKGKSYIAVRTFIALDDGVTPINRGNIAKCNMIDNIVKFNRKTELISVLPIKPENIVPKGNYALDVNAIVCSSKQYENYTEYSPAWSNENIYRSFLEILDIINYR